MNRKTLKTFWGTWAAVLALALGTLGIPSCSAGPGSEAAQDVDDFNLPSVSGKDFQLSEYKGKKPVLLYFWATWCPACLEVKSHVVRLRRQIGEERLEILAINVGTGDSFERVKKYQTGHPMPWPVLYDQDGRVSSTYGIQGIPLFILVNKDGRAVYRDHVPPPNPERYF